MTKKASFIEVTDDVLREMTQAIVDAVHPEKVILFGSHARGDVRADSDVDLAIIETEEFDEKRNRWEELRRIRRALDRFFVPKDILLFSRSEEQKNMRLRSHILTTARREGLILYERQ
ncbi:MAG: nucleotidyltransferase domain-containing protein [Candidatus Hydrogenedentes bacterium]|nr:nucleotidyltransferase domain-containing protein [Candidatus Hydrogenedentota bacterium]